MGQLNLLIVEDEDMLVESLARFFRRKVFNVFTAHGVEEAIKVIKENKQSLVDLQGLETAFETINDKKRNSSVFSMKIRSMFQVLG